MFGKALPLEYRRYTQSSLEDMGVGAQQKLTMVTALQGIVTVLFFFACFVLKDWHGDMKRVRDQQTDDHAKVMVLESSVSNIQTTVNKMDAKLDAVLNRVPGQ